MSPNVLWIDVRRTVVMRDEIEDRMERLWLHLPSKGRVFHTLETTHARRLVHATGAEPRRDLFGDIEGF